MLQSALRGVRTCVVSGDSGLSVYASTDCLLLIYKVSVFFVRHFQFVRVERSPEMTLKFTQGRVGVGRIQYTTRDFLLVFHPLLFTKI